MNKLCRCGSKQDYQACCARLIEDGQLPLTAEELMRSRYVAYTYANIDYIIATMRERALTDFDAADAKQWVQSIKWLKLTVINQQQLANERACVEFKAYYRANGRKHELHELSEFRRYPDGRWYYIGQLT